MVVAQNREVAVAGNANVFLICLGRNLCRFLSLGHSAFHAVTPQYVAQLALSIARCTSLVHLAVDVTHIHGTNTFRTLLLDGVARSTSITSLTINNGLTPLQVNVVAQLLKKTPARLQTVTLTPASLERCSVCALCQAIELSSVVHFNVRPQSYFPRKWCADIQEAAQRNARQRVARNPSRPSSSKAQQGAPLGKYSPPRFISPTNQNNGMCPCPRPPSSSACCSAFSMREQAVVPTARPAAAVPVGEAPNPVPTPPQAARPSPSPRNPVFVELQEGLQGLDRAFRSYSTMMDANKRAFDAEFTKALRTMRERLDALG